MKCLAILVNYHSADLLLQAVGSLVNGPDAGACDRICVLDNSVCALEAQRLRLQLPPQVLLVVAERNLGFAAACNLALTQHQSDVDCVLLLNPDARLLPGALARMKATLASQPKVGAVGPLVFWDDAQRFMLPPSTAPYPAAHLLGRLSLHWAGLRRWRNWRWRTQALALWQAQQVQPVAALSGGHVLLRCTALQSAGGLFDPAFFMYWEDSDLMRRLHLAGWRLLIDPKAKAIHAYEHSEQKDALLANGWPVYERKHFSAWPWRWLDALLRHCPSAPPQPINWTRLDLRGEGVRIEIPPHLHTGWLLEIALTPDFLPACGQLGTGPELHLPAHLLRRLGASALYLRLGPSKPHNPAACLHYQLFMAQQTGSG